MRDIMVVARGGRPENYLQLNFLFCFCFTWTARPDGSSREYGGDRVDSCTSAFSFFPHTSIHTGEGFKLEVAWFFLVLP